MFGFKRKIDWKDVQAVVEEITNQNKSIQTPDAAFLSSKDKQWLFIADEYQTGHKDYETIAPLSEFQYSGFSYMGVQVFKTNMDPNDTQKTQKKIYPIILHGLNWESVPNARIKGQLHLADASLLPRLDKLKQNGVLYNRERIVVEVPYRIVYPNGVHQKQKAKITAWAYLGRILFWKNLIDNGYRFKPVRTFNYSQNSLGRYYCWTKMEYHGL